MAAWKIKFLDKWLRRSMMDDEISLAYSVNFRCEDCPNDEHCMHCKLCNKTFSIANIEFGKIKSYAKKCQA